MKAFDQYFIAAAFAAFFPFFAQAQPCLRMYGESFTDCAPSVPSTYSSLSNLVEFNVTEPTAGLSPYPNSVNNPRYKAFWIWDDGNFRSFPDGDLMQDMATLHQSYSYGAADIYNPLAVLIEKKSNTTPPPSLTREVSIPAPPLKSNYPNTPDPFVTTLAPNRYVNISYSEKNRPEYPTAFVVSAEGNDRWLTGLFLFFNSLKTEASDPDFNPKTLHSLDPAHSSIKLPKYFENSPVPPFLNSPAGLPFGLDANLNFTRGIDEFQNFIYTEIDNDIQGRMPSGFSEVRYFPVLRTEWESNWIDEDSIMPVGRYLAVSIGNTPRFNSTNSSEYEVFSNMIGSVFTNIAGPDFLITDPNSDTLLYIRGIDTLEVETVLAIDPNELEVLQACPYGQDSFHVKMRLQVCNEGAMHVSDFTFRLIDHSNRLGQPEFTGSHDVHFLSAINTHEWQFQWNTYLDGVPLPGSGLPHDEALTCATAEFVLNTDWQGLEALAAGNLELCVKFPYVRDTCSFNYKFQDYCREKGYQCGDCPKEKPCATFCCHWIWLLVILVLLVLLVQFWTLWVVRRN